MITGDLGEVVLQDGDGACKGHMSTATEQGHPREAQDGGHQRCIRDPAQTLDAALEATCRNTHRRQSKG